MLQAPAIVILGFGTAVLLFTAVLLLIWAKVAPQLDWLEASFLALLGTVIFTGWLGTTLVTFGAFSLLRITAGLLVAMLGLFLRQRPFSHPKFTPLKWPEWLLLVLLLGAAIVYFRPHEYVLGGIDPGVYMNIGATAVRSGDFILTDEWTGVLEQHPDVTLRPQPSQWRTNYLQFVGWYVDDTQPNTIIPQFFPFHAMLQAVGIAVGGLYAGLLVTPLWGTLGLAALFLLSRRLFNAPVGLLAATLLALTPTHIYFARYPATEPLTLLLVFTGLLAWQALRDEQNEASNAWGVWGGAAFGAAFLTRIDLPLVALLLVGFLLLRWWQRAWHPGWTAAALTLGILSAQAGASALLLNWPYMWNTYGSVFRMLSNSSLVVAVGVVTAVVSLIFGGIMWRVPWKTFHQTRAVQWLNGSTSRWFLVGCVILLSLFAYFVRPLVQPPGAYETWLTGSEALTLDGENWVRLGWYITPLGLILATLGLAHILRTRSFDRYGLFLAVGGVTIVQYVYRIFNTAYHIYAMRRYVPIVLPMLMMYTAVALYTIATQKQRRLALASASLLTLAMVGGLIYQSRFVLPLRDLRGATAALLDFHDQLDPDAIILISEPVSSTFADTFGPPLRFIFGHDIATIRQEGGTEAFVADLVDYARERERPLQLIAVAPILDSVRTQFQLEPVAFFPIRLPKLRSTFTDFPSEIENVYYGIEIYNATPKSSANTQADWADVTIDIGSLDAAYLGDGFYGKEPLAGDITARWTSETAVVYIPLPDSVEVEVQVQARIFRPESVPETAVTVELNDVPIGQFTPTSSWQTFTFTTATPAGITQAELVFESTPFNPASLQLSGDTRSLGFLMDAIHIQPLP
jgi:hypothetical protein